MRVAVIGAGYVGLVCGACLAHKGHDITCVDMNADLVEAINSGATPIHEEGLSDLLRRNVPANLRATTDLAAAVGEADIVLLAVGTPFDGSFIDLSPISQAVAQVGSALKADGYPVVLVKSTVIPGTTDDTVLPLLEQASGRKAGRDFGVGMNPEFLREGSAVSDFLSPDRIVMGGNDARTWKAQTDLYAGFPGIDRIQTNNRTAEMIKYAANSLLATAISFANEIGNLCAETEGVDVRDVMRGVHLDKRLSPLLATGERVTPGFTTYLEAGCGFGGSCFPKDINALIAHGAKVGSPMSLLASVMEINAAQPTRVLDLLARYLPSLDGKEIAVLGLAFKPGTDDVRESPAIPVIELLRAGGARIRAYDPVALETGREILGTERTSYTNDLTAALRGCDAALILTGWPELSELPQILARSGEEPIVIDGRRMLNPSSVKRYAGIGLGPRPGDGRLP